MPQKKPIQFEKAIRQGVKDGLTDPEIAKRMGVSKNSVSSYRIKNIGPNPNYMNRIIKYDKDFTLRFVKFYKNHSHKECAKFFNLTEKEIKSLLAGCYKKSQPFKDIRQKFTKDKRRKDKWTDSEIKRMLQLVGLRPRHIIATEIKRGSSRVVKEKLRNIGLTAPKYLNGLTLSRFRSIFGIEPGFYIETDAGPTRGIQASSFFKIVPWVYIKDLILNKDLNPPEAIKKWVFAMADFQEWFHEGNAYANLFDTIEMIERHDHGRSDCDAEKILPRIS